ncbi:hypothetical protein [Rhizobium leguminosarum]|uniref:hypothetical protein n=1 Tax=Rhizobium leguminosarum TaxID=384 RepID=UPI003F953859
MDDALIEALIPSSAPRLLPSGAVVEMDIHNIGGLRRVYTWETADIAILVFVYRGSSVLAQKIGLLQSKRLYPENNDVQDDDPVGFKYGLNRFLRREPNSPLTMLNRQYDFNQDSRYGALKAGSEQVGVMDNLNTAFGEAVYYLFYNPSSLPVSTRYPVREYLRCEKPEIGCRVVSTKSVDVALGQLKEGASPSYAEVANAAGDNQLRLESWVSELLKCKVGQRFDESKETLVGRLLERRSGPIGAAIAISVVLPSD